MNDFITLEFISTFYGAITTVVLLTQIGKHVARKISPKMIALIMAACVSMVKQIATGDNSFIGWVLAALNALLMFGAAIGAFECGKGVSKYMKKEGVDTNGDSDIQSSSRRR